ncbi:hypothetical protein IFM89_036988 [Coptis chinensis]|uniref:DUF3741 domain-containing protein n=1 Tax=Coptis chinensis TaxID=261450 RepID=A0A835LKX9_9MAGN|nr:hypothetical protein IFM89_036988 [Coptis chinensis]
MKMTFTTPSSFDANVCNSQNANAFGCLSSVLRRFLGSGSLRTHPFECAKEADRVRVESNYNNFKNEQNLEPSGVVARLMGLETMPIRNTSKETIGRSRSVNSVHYLSAFDSTQMPHRRVKSSLSFREMPSFSQDDDEEFLVLSFENVHETKELVSNEVKSEMACPLNRHRRQRRDDRVENKENRRHKTVPAGKNESQEDNSKNNSKKLDKPKWKISDRPSQDLSGCDDNKHYNLNSSHNVKDHRQTDPLKTRNQKGEQDSNGTQLAEKSNNRHAVKEVECNSQNSSPVSVLDLNEFVSEPESLLSEEDSRLKCSNSRRKLSSELVIWDYPSSNFHHVSIKEAAEPELINSQVTKSTKIDSNTDEYLEAWEDVCKLAEEDLRSSNWITREKSKIKYFEDISTEFEVQILDQLLREFVQELAVLRM